MGDINSEMAFAGVLGNFEGYSQSFHTVCATLIITVDFLTILLLVAQKFPQHSLEFNRVLLFSLALCDIIYEIATMVLLSDSCEDSGNCDTLYFVYFALNLCTVFHIIVELFHKSVFYFAGNSSFASRVLCSVSCWVASFTIFYIDFENGIGLMDGSAMVFLARFKAFGYLLFWVIVTFEIVVLLSTIASAKSRSEKSPFELSETYNSRESILTSSSPRQDDLLLSCIFMAVFIGWCSWVIFGVDSRIMKTVEVMKSFEVARLTARIFNLLTILYLFFGCRKEKLVMRKPWKMQVAGHTQVPLV